MARPTRLLIASFSLTACADSVAPGKLERDPSASFAAATSPSWTITTLPTLGGTVAEAYAINDAGQVVGSSTDAAQYLYGVRWTNEGGNWTVRKIAVESTPFQGSRALAINELGTAVGWHGNNATVWRIDGSETTLGNGKANAINNSDVVVGSFTAGSPAQPAVWTPSGSGWTRRDLELLPGVTRGPGCPVEEALGISDANVIVGSVTDEACTKIPVHWRPTADGSGWLPAERLSPAGTLTEGVAQAIVGETIVGSAFPCATTAQCARRAYRWTLGGASGSLGEVDARANGLNRAGFIVGSSVAKSGRMSAFMWSPSTSTFATLPSLKSANHSWAWDINDASPRQAVGVVTLNSGGHVAALWTLP